MALAIAVPPACPPYPTHKIELMSLLSRTFVKSIGPPPNTTRITGPLEHWATSLIICSILWVGYGGQAGGTAIANAIFGVFSPAGRLPHTVYPANFVNQVTDTNMGFRPSSVNPGRTYRFYTGTPVYEFGYGLSYTNFTFKYANVTNNVVPRDLLDSHLYSEEASFLTAPTLAGISVQVTNTGTVTSDVVVLAFISGPNAGKNGNPIKSLIGFTRFFALAPNASKSIVFPVTSFDLSVVDENGKRSSEVGNWKVSVEGQETILRVI